MAMVILIPLKLDGTVTVPWTVLGAPIWVSGGLLLLSLCVTYYQSIRNNHMVPYVNQPFFSVKTRIWSQNSYFDCDSCADVGDARWFG